LSYQWQRNNVNIRGATQATYVKSNVQDADNNSNYRVIVRNAVGQVTSRNAVLTVNQPAPLLIVSQPPAKTYRHYSEPISLSVVATGDNVTYELFYRLQSQNNFTRIGALNTLSFAARSGYSGEVFYRFVVRASGNQSKTVDFIVDFSYYKIVGNEVYYQPGSTPVLVSGLATNFRSISLFAARDGNSCHYNEKTFPSCSPGTFQSVAGTSSFYKDAANVWIVNYNRLNPIVFVPAANPATFSNVPGASSFWGRDDKRLFYKTIGIPVADTASLRGKSNYLAMNNTNCYFASSFDAPVAMPNCDPNTIDAVYWELSTGTKTPTVYSKDANRVYYKSTLLSGENPAVTKAISTSIITGSVRAYHYGKVIPDSNASSFKLLDKANWATDSDTIFVYYSAGENYNWPRRQNANASALTPFQYESRSNPGQFFNSLYARVGNTVYCGTSTGSLVILTGLDIASFKPINVFAGSDKAATYNNCVRTPL
jgi:hypothetical protein